VDSGAEATSLYGIGVCAMLVRMRWAILFVLVTSVARAQTYAPASLAVSSRDRPWDAYGWMPTGALGPSRAFDTALQLAPPVVLSALFERRLWSNWLQPTPRRAPVGMLRDRETGELTLKLLPDSHDLSVYANQPLLDRATVANLQRLNDKMTNLAIPIVGAAVLGAAIATIVESAKSAKPGR
jgi:hypothetical protein